MSGLTRDIRYAIRTLRNAPGFVAAAVLTLGLGIGANSAIFSVINAVLLHPLAFEQSGQLVTIEHSYPSSGNLLAPVSTIGFERYQQRRDVFQNMAVESGWNPTLIGQGEPVTLRGSLATGEFFRTYRVHSALGRVFDTADAVAGREVVVLSAGFAARQFGSGSSALGKQMVLDGKSYTVIGVMPADFQEVWNRRADLWAPLVLTPAMRNGNEWLALSARLANGVTPEHAQTVMHQVAANIKADQPLNYPRDWDLAVTTLAEKVGGGLRQALLMLMGAVALVLLIACANVANLQLARAAARSREIAVRTALGASPGAVLRQLLTESLLIGVAGGAAGILMAIWGVPLLLRLDAGNLPAADAVRLSAPVLGFTLIVSLLTGVLFGLAPAWRVSRRSLQDTLRESGRGTAGDRSGLALQRGLVVTTVALALTLLIGAGLLLRSFSTMLRVNPGFDPERLLVVGVPLPNAKYGNDTVRIAAFERITAEFRSVPGVTAAGATTVMPFGRGWSTGTFNVEGFQPPPGALRPWGDIRVITPGFLAALGTNVVNGRDFQESDDAASPPVAIIDQELAHQFWPNQDPLGKRVTFNNFSDTNVTWIRVIGVVPHTMQEGLDGGHRIQLYLPLRQSVGSGVRAMQFAVRTTGNPLAARNDVRNALHRVDAELPFGDATSMTSLISASTGRRRFSMILLSVFSVIAGSLAVVGLYGVMAFSVARRYRELGVRLALGATRQEVMRMVLGQGMRLVGIGLAIGVVAALASSRLLGKMLFGVAADDPLSFVSVPLLLIVVTSVAAWLPARRATRVDPVQVLRDD